MKSNALVASQTGDIRPSFKAYAIAVFYKPHDDRKEVVKVRGGRGSKEPSRSLPPFWTWFIENPRSVLDRRSGSNV